MDINLTINLVAPELTAALLAICRPQTAAAPTPAVAQPAPSAPAAPVAPPVAPVTPPAPIAPPVAVPAAPVVPPPPTVPLAAPPAYTLEQLQRAGADLITRDPAKGPAAHALLAQYGVQAVTELRPEQFGSFATALRGLGASL